MKMEMTLQTRQSLSQVQVQSLHILSMTMIELQEFMQNEEIENPLIEYSGGRQGEELPVAYQDYDRFYNGDGDRNEDGEGDLHEMESARQSVEDLIMTQIDWGKLQETERRIVDTCIQSLDRNGFLTISPAEIAGVLGTEKEAVERVLGMLRQLEPVGIFSAGLEDCLSAQVRGMEAEEYLEQMIRRHLQDVAEGRISSISRALNLPTVEVRRLIRVLKELNPRPLNGYGEERAQYIVPDIIVTHQDGQWTIGFNDAWTGSIGVNDYYLRMLETVEDAELKQYFEEKVQRARFVVNAIEQRRKTMRAIATEILKRQSGYLLGTEPLKPMTLEMVAEACQIHKSTVSRGIRDKHMLAPIGCIPMRALFTTGISGKADGGAEISRNTIKERLKVLVETENRKKPYSDEQLVKLLGEDGIEISRRTVAKYRTEMGIGGAFQRKES